MRNTACQAIRRPLPVTRHHATLVWSLHPVVRAAAGTNACRPLLRGYYPFQPVRRVYLADGIQGDAFGEKPARHPRGSVTPPPPH